MTTPHPAAPVIPAAPLRIALIVLALFTALSAVGGAIALLAGVLGVPLSVLEGSVFTDFFWPAILLGVVIGGTQVVAAVSALRRSPLWLFWSAVAGFAMVVFIFVELAIMRGFSFLHGLYFVTGLAQVILVVALLGVLPSVVRAGD
jgi:hypothetical protein